MAAGPATGMVTPMRAGTGSGVVDGYNVVVPGLQDANATQAGSGAGDNGFQAYFLSQQQAMTEKAALQQELAQVKDELATTRTQLQETLENVSVLEEGQVFLLQKHRETVSEHHEKGKRMKEEAAREQRLLAEQHAVQLERQQQQMENLAAQQNQQMHEVQEQLEQYKAQQQVLMSQPPQIDVSGRAEIHQLLAVIEDLQKAIDEKNELIDVLSAQVAQYQSTADEARRRQSDLTQEMNQQRTHEAQQAELNAIANAQLGALRDVMEARDRDREGQIKTLTDEILALKTELAKKQAVDEERGAAAAAAAARAQPPQPPPQEPPQVAAVRPPAAAAAQHDAGLPNDYAALMQQQYGNAQPQYPFVHPERHQSPAQAALAADIADVGRPASPSQRRAVSPSPMSRLAHSLSAAPHVSMYNPGAGEAEGVSRSSILSYKSRAIFSPPKPA